MSLTEDLTAIQNALTRYVLPICLLFGIVGNLLNIIVFCQKHLRKNSCSVYFISTSIFNFLVMLFGVFPVILTSYLSYDYASYSISYCKFRSYIVHVLLMMSRFSVALASIDRFAACSTSIHIRFFNQYPIAVRSVMIVSLLWLLIPSHMLVEVTIQMPTRRCGGSGNYSTIYGIYSIIATGIPLLIMVIFSSLAIQGLQHVRARVHPIASTNNLNIPKNCRMKRRDGQLLRLLVGEVLVYFFSTVLFPVYSTYVAITSTTTKTKDRLAIEGLMRYFSLSFLIYVNACSIFYVHLFISKAFRHECKQLFLNLDRKQPTNLILLNTTSASNLKRQPNRVHAS